MTQKMALLGTCSDACAAPLQGTYQRVSQLSIPEARKFVDDVNRCVARCQ